jgi:hypothetical protein
LAHALVLHLFLEVLKSQKDLLLASYQVEIKVFLAFIPELFEVLQVLA